MVVLGFLGTLVGSVFGAETLRQTGKIPSLFPGLKSVTQIGISLGVASSAIKNSKSILKFK